ncbi:hypothetical protein OIU34_22005 [Pararhizobium sp. BT-229]|uniref:hypothetical protein n=1 Tax=Pararhizobium sp. BT-229 TaxID=2986923 RepID=UPI0021F6F1B4|nr:hypothetical protein [Pararhizobium sp. BT-229]MCV9964567.1 hypothetical protein [Pararhizobium sp. BT-229]
MRISVPFSYKVSATPYKHKLPSTMSMVENAWVDVPDVDVENLLLALVVRDAAGRDIEHVYTYAGEFWVKDERGAGDLPFLSQHLPVAGQKIPEARTSSHFSRADEESQLTAATNLLGKVGMLRTRTAGVGAYEARNWMFNGQNGPEFVEVTVESEKARNVTSSTREERLQRARTLAHNHCISVDGVLYHRVAEPCLVSRSSMYCEVRWTFGCPDFFTPEGLSKNHGYPVSAKDFDRVHDWFDTSAKAAKVDFSFDVLDESPFRTRADRIALVSSAHRVVADGLSKENSTPYIAKWCEVRDYLAALWQGEEGKLTPASMLERDEADFDRLAGLLDDIGQFGEKRKYGGELDLQGLKMWDGRTFALEIAARGPSL